MSFCHTTQMEAGCQAFISFRGQPMIRRLVMLPLTLLAKPDNSRWLRSTESPLLTTRHTKYTHRLKSAGEARRQAHQQSEASEEMISPTIHVHAAATISYQDKPQYPGEHKLEVNIHGLTRSEFDAFPGREIQCGPNQFRPTPFWVKAVSKTVHIFTDEPPAQQPTDRSE